MVFDPLWLIQHSTLKNFLVATLQSQKAVQNAFEALDNSRWCKL